MEEVLRHDCNLSPVQPSHGADDQVYVNEMLTSIHAASLDSQSAGLLIGLVLVALAWVPRKLKSANPRT